MAYRAWTEYEASQRNLSGWVRNRSDGTVEAMFIGAPEDVDTMLDACRVGPPAARVSAVKPAPENDDAPAPRVEDGRFVCLPTV